MCWSVQKGGKKEEVPPPEPEPVEPEEPEYAPSVSEYVCAGMCEPDPVVLPCSNRMHALVQLQSMY